MAKKPAKKPDGKDGYVTQTKAKQVIGCDYKTLQNAFAAGLEKRDDNLVHLETAKAWFADRHRRKELGAELLNEKKQAEIDKLKADRERREFELATMRGENHSTKDCAASLGQLLTAVWMDIQAMPSRGQAAFPENPQLEKVLADIVNDSSEKLRVFLKEHGIILDS